MGDLETLQAVAALSFTTDDIKNLVNKLCAFSVVTLGPVVSCTLLQFALSVILSKLTSTTLAEDEVVRSEELTERTSSDGIHRARLEIDKDSSGDIFVAGRLSSC